MVSGKKILYNNKYYSLVDDLDDKINIFEYGNIVYGKDVDNVLKKGVLIE